MENKRLRFYNQLKDVLLSVAALFILFLGWQGCNQQKVIGRLLNKPTIIKTDSATPVLEAIYKVDTFWRDGEPIVRYTPVAKIQTPTQSALIELKPVLDSLQKEINQPAKVDRQQIINTVFVDYRDSIKTLLVKIDSLKSVIRVTNAVFKNQYLTFNPAQQKTDTVVVAASYNYNAEIVSNQKAITARYFGAAIGKRRSYILLTTLDSNATINGKKKYEYTLNEPQYGLRIQAVLGYNTITQAFTFGPGIRMDIGRFSINSSYPYNFSRKQFTPALSLTGDLIRF